MEPLVLIVDDNEKNLKLARDVLQAAGFRTLEAETGAEAIALAAEHLPDVILMDLRLPDMDGADAARALSGAAETAGIPVVALTRYGWEASSLRCSRAISKSRSTSPRSRAKCAVMSGASTPLERQVTLLGARSSGS